jgi:hypothetical protein
VQFSIREMLCVITLLAIGFAGIISGHPAAWAASFVFAAVILANAIDALVASGTRKQFAIGFVVPSLFYLSLLAMLGQPEFEANDWSQLPTSRVARLLVRPAYTTHKDMTIVFERGMAGRNSMPLAHLFFATALGYAGGSYARWSATRCRHIVSQDGG